MCGTIAAAKYLGLTRIFGADVSPNENWPFLIGTLSIGLIFFTMALVAAQVWEFANRYFVDKQVPVPKPPKFGSNDGILNPWMVRIGFVAPVIYSTFWKTLPIAPAALVVWLTRPEMRMTLEQLGVWGT